MANYAILSHELVENSGNKRFLGQRWICRYCGATDRKAFGKPQNAHAIPAGLGNRDLFSLDECRECNTRFSSYEDALTKAVGPFLTLGGQKGRKSVRQTGSTGSSSTIRHSRDDSGRRISIRAHGEFAEQVRVDTSNGRLKLTAPVKGDKFVPRFAYKALLKIAIALMPAEELDRFSNAIASLQTPDALYHPFPLQVGLSYASVGNAPPVLGAALLRRTDPELALPYMVLVFTAGSLCFQIWVRSDNFDEHVPTKVALDLRWTSNLSKPEGGYFPIQYGVPEQLDWTGTSPILQPFEAFELDFDPRTTAGVMTPIRRGKPVG